MADRLPHDLRGTGLGRRGDSHELLLGATLMIVTVIAGQEMAHLIGPLPAIISLAAASLGGLAHERAT